MVSTIGYGISEYVFFVMLSYFLTVIYFITLISLNKIKDKPIAYNFLQFFVVEVVLFIFNLSNIRLGFVMFIDGMLFYGILFYCVEIIKLLMFGEEPEPEEEYQYEQLY